MSEDDPACPACGHEFTFTCPDCEAEVGVEEGDIDDMLPAAVLVLARAVNEHIAQSLSVPGE